MVSEECNHDNLLSNTGGARTPPQSCFVINVIAGYALYAIDGYFEEAVGSTYTYSQGISEKEKKY